MPYKYTSLPLFFPNFPNNNLSSFSSNHTTEQLIELIFQSYLNEWKGLRTIPKCWKALQSLLCATFFPRCDQDSSQVWLATYNMCRALRGPCRLIDNHFSWPSFLKCENHSLFASYSSKVPKCENKYTDFRFNTEISGPRCQDPLVDSRQESLWYPEIDGCSLRCESNPLYSIEQHSQIRLFINIASKIAFNLTCFAWLTFLVDSKRPNLYPSKIILIINLCLMISYTGWWLDHVIDRREITCRPDNTVRLGNQSGHFYCSLSFTILYYFSMAALSWFVMFAYCCMISYRTTGNDGKYRTRSEELAAKENTFHIIAWTVPFGLTTLIWLTGEIDGDSMYGVCFVGLADNNFLVMFVFIPVGIAFIACVIMLTKTLSQLRVIRHITLEVSIVFI